MSKTIRIPTDKGSRIVVTINKEKYIYEAGDTVTVPDEVAALLESNEYAEYAPRKAVAQLNPKKYGKEGAPVYSDEYGNMYTDPVAALDEIHVEEHMLVIPDEE